MRALNSPIENRAAIRAIGVTVIQRAAANRTIVHKTLAAIGTLRFTDRVQCAAHGALKALNHSYLYMIGLHFAMSTVL